MDGLVMEVWLVGFCAACCTLYCLTSQLISESMVPYVEQTDSQYGYRLDHSTTVLEFCKRKKEKEKLSRNLIVPC